MQLLTLPIDAAVTDALPYLFSDEELSSFFAATDTFPTGKFNSHRQYVISAIFRLIYCCGLRPNEARLLKTENVNLSSGQILIKNPKMNKDRIVVMADDVVEMCCHYNSIIENAMPQRAYFFPNMKGITYAPNTPNLRMA